MIDSLVVDRVELVTRRELGDGMSDAVRIANLGDLTDGDFALLYCTVDGRRLAGLCLDIEYAKLIRDVHAAGLLETPLEIESGKFIAWRKGWASDWADGTDPGPWVPTVTILG
ncbi:hypothetical protein ABZ801_00940 [Actinomadura sp. NPDC047616]|uniref:hypothetical protein n=1 Tax=Actinomadura sp. NPDC047616 TaxID=3155914 RepID=UPI0034113785